MLGKASQLRVAEVEIIKIDSFLLSHPTVTVIDMKYQAVLGAGSYALIIYKEGESS